MRQMPIQDILIKLPTAVLAGDPIVVGFLLGRHVITALGAPSISVLHRLPKIFRILLPLRHVLGLAPRRRLLPLYRGVVPAALDLL